MGEIGTTVWRKRKNYGRIPHIMDIPNLIEVQWRSYERFLQVDVPHDQREDVGLQAVFQSVFPISDFKENSYLEFVTYTLGEPKYGVVESRHRGVTFAAPLKVTVRLVVCEKEPEQEQKMVRAVKEQEIYLGEIPMMTEQGTFIINGTERTVVSQMHRSAGIFFHQEKGKDHFGMRSTYEARLIPYRGSWVEFELASDGFLYVRIDRRRKLFATTLLRALELENDEEILREFYPTEEVTADEAGQLFVKLDPEIHLGTRVTTDLTNPKSGEVLVKHNAKLNRSAVKKIQDAGINSLPVSREGLSGRVSAQDIVDEETGEIWVECNKVLDDDTIGKIIAANKFPLKLLVLENSHIGNCLRDTLLKDPVRDKKTAWIEIYKRMRPGDPPTVDNAKFLFREMFFNAKRYDLSKVGRLKLNKKLGLDSPLSERTLTGADFIAIFKYIMGLPNGYGEIDDIDHLGNRRVRSVGELLENQFRIGLVRMERAVRERMSIQELDELMPHDLINAKPVSAVIKEFFGSSQLSQFMDQTNPLAELTHKRRLSALGPGGLSRERAGFEARDVHTTHYGRICPIETPEGPNIGLISSLSTYARINDYGFIEAPYRKVDNGRVTDKIEFLSAIEEAGFTIAQANTPLDKDGKIILDRVSARAGGEFVQIAPDRIDHMDVSPKQLVSVSAALIPFLENDDANRALMGSNMQRQAVPLLRTQAPLVGTGMEAVVARDSGTVILAKRSGIVESVNANRIIVRAVEQLESEPEVDVYNLVKFQRSNQNTCINQKPIVRIGQKVLRGQVICDGPATDKGELALGRNVLVAFMPWRGHNFEDAILVSEKLVKEDAYTSIHIEEFEIEARDTKLGKEEITRDIPNVGEDNLRNLDESGIIRVGAEVKPGDILVGKVTPKGETQLTPEEKLLRAIFGEKAGDVRDASLVVPPGIEGVVVEVRIFSRRGVDKDKRARSIEQEDGIRLEKDFDDEVRIVKNEEYRKVRELLKGQIVAFDIVDAQTGETIIAKGAAIDEAFLAKAANSFLDKNEIKVKNAEVTSQIQKIRHYLDHQLQLLRKMYDDKIERLSMGGDLPPGVIKLVKVYVAMKRKLSVGDKMAGRHGNKGVLAKILPEEDMPFLADGSPIEIVLNPLGVPSRMNVGQILETHLGWAANALGMHVAVPVFDAPTENQIKEELKAANLPEDGKMDAFDGRTGERFHQRVTVGYIYILKLAHLVDDKIHARSIGPYSLVTQQPLGGKAQFGGQRFGEMEVWALEAYGAAYTLQEMLTIKSDDVQGRTKAYEAIVKGEGIHSMGIPESFNVLVKELQSLCLNVELIKQEEIKEK
ncbi:MAG: DNA-directed RNA polymerase subunit beta [Candidatus Schekmanbacteria bacterium]|nr:DNA-directed RNA polymerase subunit beta [Candidatus Schekmanbacteria bacterium]